MTCGNSYANIRDFRCFKDERQISAGYNAFIVY